MTQQIEYHSIPDYSMKCRLYPTPHQKKMLDEILFGVRLAYNNTVYAIFEKNDKRLLKSDVFINFDYIVTAEWLHELIANDERIRHAPSASITNGKNGVFRNNLKRSCCYYKKLKRGVPRKLHTGENGKPAPLPITQTEAHYFSKKHPCSSFYWQLRLSAIKPYKNNNPDTPRTSDVLYIRVPYTSTDGKSQNCFVKCVGFNTKLKFGEHHNLSFVEYIEQHHSQKIGTRIIKDNCGDYFISFTFSGKKWKDKVWKPMKAAPPNSTVGVDVGIEYALTPSVGAPVNNKRYKQKEAKTLAVLERKLSRMQGYKNPAWRKKQKELPAEEKEQPSNNYKRTMRKYQQLHRRIANKRAYHNHKTTRHLIEQYQRIACETLDIMEMVRKDTKKRSKLDKRTAKTVRKGFNDVAVGMILRQLEYKCAWHDRTLGKIDQYFPSSKTCRVCRYKNDELTLSDRQWTCPNCGTLLDRDRNAALMIQYEAFPDTDPYKSQAI